MTIIEMHDLADLLIDKANSPWFNPSEKDRFINLAHMEFVEDRCPRFELNKKVRQELSTLVKVSTGTSVSQFSTTAITDFLYIANLIATFDDGCGGSKTRPVSPIQLDDEGYTDLDPFQKPTDNYPGYVQENNGTDDIVIIKSTTVPTSYTLKYIKKPVNVFRDVNNPANNINSELPDGTHEEIVNIAVRKMLASVDDQLKYQVQQNEISKQP